MRKRIIATMILTTLLCQVICTGTLASAQEKFARKSSYLDGQFVDVTPSNWFSDNVATVYELGLMKGNSSNTFNPTGTLSTAEAIVLAARLHSIYYTGTDEFEKSTPWYQTYSDYAVKNGIVSEAYLDYEKPIIRSEFASVLAKVLPANELNTINQIANNAIPDISNGSTYADAVYMLYRSGIVTGNDKYGTFGPDATISRSAAAAIVTRIAVPELRQIVTLVAKSTTLSADFDGTWFSYYVNPDTTVSNHPEFKQVVSLADSTVYSADIKGDFKSSPWTLSIAGNDKTATYATDYADVILKLLPNGAISETRTLYNDKSKKAVHGIHSYIWKHQDDKAPITPDIPDTPSGVDKNNITKQITLKQSKASEYIYLYKVERIDFEYNQSVLDIYLPHLNQAQSDLAIAQTTTVRIYREGEGFVYVPDASKISAAQLEVDKYRQKVEYSQAAIALNKEVMQTLEQQLRSIQAEIHALEESLK